VGVNMEPMNVPAVL
jgi:hypothetical protein